jgi:hypothetical protein
MANNAHKLLKFTFEISKISAVFLDLEIFKGPRFIESGILDIKSYSKPTETFQYLERDSAHPSSVFSSLIQGETTRHMRNKSSRSTFTDKIDIFCDKLVSRGYSKSEIKDTMNKVDYTGKSKTLLRKERKNAESKLCLTTTYDPKWNKLNATLHKHWDEIIGKNTHLNRIFPKKPIITYRKGKSIGDSVTSTVPHQMAVRPSPPTRACSMSIGLMLD